MRKEFKADSPELILLISDNKRQDRLEKLLDKGLNGLDQPYALLPLYIKPGDLKNMLTAIKLMDVKGLFLAGKYQNEGNKFADIVHDKELTNVVVFRDNKYQGHNITVDMRKSDPSYLPHLAASCINLWANRSIDIKKSLKN